MTARTGGMGLWPVRRKVRSGLRGLAVSLALLGALVPGCGTLFILPLAQITATQLFDQPNFTVQFSIEDAVSDPSLVTSVNWVFGDSPGFTTGGVTITHQYAAGGTFSISAFVFSASGLVGEITGTVTVVVSDKASQPSPVDGATNVSINVTLSWTAGGDNPQHNVYLGTDEAAVTAATPSSPEFRGQQSATQFTPPTLAGGTVHYWRIDEVRPSGTTTGDVWQFTTAIPPEPASDPTPVNGSTGEAIDVDLMWVAGAGATSHDVYFGTDATAVTNATRTSGEFQGNQAGTTFSPANLEADTEYFWRIDEVGPGGTTPGEVFSFTTAPAPGTITNPIPEDEAVDVAVDVTLMWTAGSDTSSHDVYFGTSETAVTDATRSSSQFKGNQTETSFSPTGLETNTVYFWRIDEVGPGGTTKGETLQFTTIHPTAAREPAPEHEAEDVPLNQVLSWTIGDGATGHDVYFGTSESAVTAATKTDDEFQGNFPSAMFTPTLEAGTTYFWRIDEVNMDGTVKGPTWRFTTVQTPPEQASAPDPSDGATNVAINKVLGWTAGERAESHDVYFGTDMTAVTNATTASPEFRGNRVNTTFNPGALTRSTTYYWRIDEKNSAGPTTGDVWSFTTVPPAPTKATNPNPPHMATDQNVNSPDAGVTVLSWTAGTGTGTIRHDVYLGTSESAVTNATTSSPEFRVNQAGTTFDPGVLLADTDYFWRIDEVNAGGTTKGDVWMFSTAVAPQKATAPSPTNAATGVAIPVTLMWTAGTGATSHDVYFGTSSSGVTSATRASSQFRGNQAGTSFSGPFGVTIEGGTQYFWRIDEVGPGGVTKGDTWSFTTAQQPPGQATNPSPFNGATGISTSATLSWTAGSGATMHQVFFGTNQTDVTNGDPSVDQGTTTQNSFNPGMLNAATQYFWRIDAINDAGTTTGVVWTFTTQ